MIYGPALGKQVSFMFMAMAKGLPAGIALLVFQESVRLRQGVRSYSPWLALPS